MNKIYKLRNAKGFVSGKGGAGDTNKISLMES